MKPHLILCPPPAPVPEPRRIEGEAEYIHQARLQAVKRMGTAWRAHPDYVRTPRHSNLPEIYEAARVEYLASITRAAVAARNKNRMAQQAERVRKALEG